MLLASRERSIDLAQGIVDFVGAFASGAIALLKREVGRVPFVGINTTCPSSAIDLLSRVAFHPLHGWVFASLFVPVTVMDECLLGWERHIELRSCRLTLEIERDYHSVSGIFHVYLYGSQSK